MAHVRGARPLAIPVLALAFASCAAPAPPSAAPDAGREQPILEYQPECSQLKPREAIVRVRWPVPAKPVDVRIEVSPYKDGFSTGRFVSAPAGDPRAVPSSGVELRAPEVQAQVGENAEPPRDSARVAPLREGRHTDRGRPRGAQSRRQLLHPRARRPRPDDTRAGADLPGRLRRNPEGVAKVKRKYGLRRGGALISLVPCLSLLCGQAHAQVRSFSVQEINPDRSTLDVRDPYGASGGRVNHLAVSREGPMFAASEWGGLFRSNDQGSTWQHVPGHVSTADLGCRGRPGNGATRLCHVTLRRQGRKRRRHQRQPGRRLLLVSSTDRHSAGRFLSQRGAPRRTIRVRHRHQSGQPQQRPRRHELRPGDQRRSRPDLALRGSDSLGRRR